MWIHPVLQTLNLALSAYVLYLGYKRFAFAHLGRKGMFPWKQHVRLGTAGMAVWGVGLGLGLFMAWWSWGVVLITGAHHLTALGMVPLLVFGYASGWVMDRRKAKRKALPLAHAANNLLLVVMTLSQFVTGIGVLRTYVLP